MKRIVLFLAVNVLAVITISILQVLGLRGYLTQNRIDYPTLLGFASSGAWWRSSGSAVGIIAVRNGCRW
jgi:hypothetical protein